MTDRLNTLAAARRDMARLDKHAVYTATRLPSTIRAQVLRKVNDGVTR